VVTSRLTEEYLKGEAFLPESPLPIIWRSSREKMQKIISRLKGPDTKLGAEIKDNSEKLILMDKYKNL
jgi:hypothetical protein